MSNSMICTRASLMMCVLLCGTVAHVSAAKYGRATGANIATFNANSNTATGTDAMKTGQDQPNLVHNNTADGYQALYNDLSGDDNTAIGYQAGINITKGSNNINIGSGVSSAANEKNAIRIGNDKNSTCYVGGIYNAPASAFSKSVYIAADGQLAIGEASIEDSGYNFPDDLHITGGGDLTVTGSINCYQNLNVNNNKFNVTAASGNTTIAGTVKVAGASNFSGDVNVVAGGDLTVTGSGNIYGSLTVDTDKFVVIGNGTGNTTIAGSLNVGNTILGRNSLTMTGSTTLLNDLTVTGSFIFPTTQRGVIEIGNKRFAYANGNFGTFIGQNAGNFSMSSSWNTAVGYQALNAATTGGLNTALGFNALLFNNTGQRNTALGLSSLAYNTSGNQNTAAGEYSLTYNENGSYNTAFGADALFKNTTGSNNTASGWYAMNHNTAGDSNTASGSLALYSNTGSNSHNAAFGYRALYSNGTEGNGGGEFNVAVGDQALDANTTGSWNTAVGSQALDANYTGSYNVALGFDAGSAIVGGHDNICIGANVTGLVTDSGVIRIGDLTATTSTYVAGIRGVATVVPDAVTVVIASDGQLGVTPSSRRFKEDIKDMPTTSVNDLNKLRPVTFNYNTDATKHKQYGLIAEEVEGVYPETVVYDKDGQVFTVRYDQFVPMLIEGYQQQQSKLDALATVAGEKRGVVLNDAAQPAFAVTFSATTLPVVATITFVSGSVAYSSKFLFDGTGTVTPLYSESTLGSPATITATCNGATVTFNHQHASVPGGTTTGALFYEVTGVDVVSAS